MAKYRKKPIEIEAFQFYVDNIPDWFMDRVTTNEIKLFNCDYSEHYIEDAYCEIQTLEGIMRGNGGDYIIKEPFATADRQIYPCKKEIFEKTYDEV